MSITGDYVPGQITSTQSDGWRCPVCGRGNAPWMASCPCYASPMVVTSGTATAWYNCANCGTRVSIGSVHSCASGTVTLSGM